MIMKRTSSDTFFLLQLLCLHSHSALQCSAQVDKFAKLAEQAHLKASQIQPCRRCVLAKLHFKQITLSSILQSIQSIQCSVCALGQGVWAHKLCGASREPLRPDTPDSRLGKTFDTLHSCDGDSALPDKSDISAPAGILNKDSIFPSK